MHTILAYALPLFLAAPAATDDEPKKVAIAYLKALDGSGSQTARELLLGGVTLTAEEVSIPNWKIQDRLVQREEDDVKLAVELMKALDKSGAQALTEIMNLAESGSGDDIGMATVSQEQANKLMAPTQVAAKRFKERFPVFAYCARAGKEVYWHPANPWREVVKKLGTSGRYVLEFHRFNVLETVGGKSRVWPLRVLRIKTSSYDSGWKILPASDWDPDW